MSQRFAILFCFWVGFFSGNAFAQVEYTASVSHVTHASMPEERLPHSQFLWEDVDLPSLQKNLNDEGHIITLTETAPLPFTGLAIGWKAEGDDLSPRQFQLEIRSRPADKEWGDWTPASGHFAPGDSPSGLFWSTLYVTSDGSAHDEFEVNIKIPGKTAITYLKVTAADARFDGNKQEKSNFYFKKEKGDTPDIITRDGWWGSLPPDELEPDYTPTQIEITHSLVHHTVTSNEPPDPEQVIRQIWDWHVNDNGWSDIGYNFLFDHQGNIYQGRYNPWLESTDVQGAHAGRSNSSSTGLALLGQFEPGAQPQFGDPSALALNALVEIISWRFTQNDIDPFGVDWLAVNPNGSERLPVISGHRDVSSTACPGDNLYSMLYQIRDDVSLGETEEEEEIADLPFELGQNYPNPFQSQTTIPFTLEETGDVNIDLYTVRGQKIREIYSENNVDSGSYDIPFNAEGLSSGAYYYEFSLNGTRQMKLMVFIR